MRRRNERRTKQAEQDETLDGLRRYMRQLDTRALRDVIERSQLAEATRTMRHEAQIAAEILKSRRQAPPQRGRLDGTRTG